MPRLPPLSPLARRLLESHLADGRVGSRRKTVPGVPEVEVEAAYRDLLAHGLLAFGTAEARPDEEVLTYVVTTAGRALAGG